MHTEATDISQRSGQPKNKLLRAAPHIVVVIIAIWEIAYWGLSKALPGLVTQRHIGAPREAPVTGKDFGQEMQRE